MKLSHVKKITVCAMCIALGCVLPFLFGSLMLGTIRLGQVLSPIHIPVLLCGLVCGGFYGAVCGLLSPILGNLIFSAPYAAALPAMIPELIVYGLISGICMGYIRTGHSAADVYISLAAAMLAGRIVGGIVNIVIASATTGVYSFSLWFSSYFVTAFPGIIVHLILIPALLLALQKARVIPSPYQKAVQE